MDDQRKHKIKIYFKQSVHSMFKDKKNALYHFFLLKCSSSKDIEITNWDLFSLFVGDLLFLFIIGG